MHHPIDRITHTTAFVTPVVEHWLEREIAQWEVLYWIQIRTEGRPRHDSYVGSGFADIGIVLLEHVMLVAAKIGQNVKLNDLIDIPKSRATITWAYILKDNRSRFKTDHDGSPNHDALPTPSHIHLQRSPLLRQTRTLLSTLEIQNRLSFEKRTLLHCWYRQCWQVVAHCSGSCRWWLVRIGPWTWILLEAKRRRTVCGHC